MISTKAIRVTRGKRHLVDTVNFHAAPGKFTVIIGPNGAGKSTFLKVLSNDITPDHGSVTLLDRDMSHWPRKDIARHRAVLPQNCNLNFGFQVRDVVRLGRLPFGQSDQDMSLVDHALHQVGLDGMQRRMYPELSGGEQRRVQIARVLVQITDAADAGRGILLLDEPTANLDPAHAFIALQQASNLAKQGLTVVAVVHDINLAMPFADEIYALKDGRILFHGPRDQVMTTDNLRSLYDINAAVLPHPDLSCPMIAFLPK